MSSLAPRIVGAVLLAACLGLPATGATLRNATSLAGPTVRLSDLFDGVEADRPLGPGPELGNRIVVEAPQLAAIARQFGVDWRPSSPADSIVLDRPGRLFPREAAVAALRTALHTSGVSDDADLEIPGFVPPTVPPGDGARAEVGQLDYNPTDGRFTATLSVTSPGAAPVHARMSGRAIDMLALPVATRRLLPGDVIAPGDLQMGRLRAGAVRGEVAQSPDRAIGMALRHPIGPGAPFPMTDLMRPSSVEKGKSVQMTLETAGLSVSAQGLAMDSGALGEHVRVLNPQSRAMIDAEVIGAGRVRVSGTAPVLLPSNAALPIRLASP